MIGDLSSMLEKLEYKKTADFIVKQVGQM